MNYQVVVPAAGEGKRMQRGQNKQFILLGEKPVIVHTLNVFQEDVNCKGIVVVANEKDVEVFRRLLPRYRLTKVRNVAIGGKERQDSVYEGLQCLSESDGIVLIHDGARPFVTSDMIERVTLAAERSGAAVLAVPVKDTIKRAADGGVVKETIDRSSLWAVQTPQAFRLSLIKKAYTYGQKHQLVATDDASLVENAGFPVAIVQGSDANIKLTTPHDLLVADAMLKQSKGERF